MDEVSTASRPKKKLLLILLMILPVFFFFSLSQPEPFDDWPPPGTFILTVSKYTIKHSCGETLHTPSRPVSGRGLLSLLSLSVSALSDHAPLLISTGASFLHQQYTSTLLYSPSPYANSTPVSRTAVGHTSLYVGTCRYAHWKHKRYD